DTFKGVQYLHEPTNFLFTGAVDDIWINPAKELHVVDYKATSKNGEVNIDAEWQAGYKRQMEMYQWVLRRNEFEVSDTAYFVYANGRTDTEAFDARLEFEVKVIPYTGDDSWVEQKLFEARDCLASDTLPEPAGDCEYCEYRKIAREAE
ncbi:MAG: PD-(D/E)XK nuclease family protein, partial [Candidatus Pacearchaeota archaeon]|nr:PD-(D/E)XK nuclease family protein [Candidatus Pacearchaeota archaeon]